MKKQPSSQQVIIRKSTMILHNKQDINSVYFIEKGVSIPFTKIKLNLIEAGEWFLWNSADGKAQNYGVRKGNKDDTPFENQEF